VTYVDVRTGMDDDDAALRADPTTLLQTARDALRIGLSLRDTTYGGNSGMVARAAGVAVNADRHLPTMGTEEFVSCLSKSEMEAVGSASGVVPRQTGKATRSAVIERLKHQAYVYPLPASRRLRTKAMRWPGKSRQPRRLKPTRPLLATWPTTQESP
jgi:ParB family chromosome partitioning protein